MFCSHCGNEIDNDSLFCSKCGRKISNDITDLECESCGSFYILNREKEMFICPHCGHQRLFLESDELSIERIRTKHEYEMKQLDYEISEKNEIRDIKIAVLSVIVMLISTIMFVLMKRFLF